MTAGAHTQDGSRIDKLRPYRKYKNTGAAWLPKIPESWSLVRNGQLFAQRNETGFEDLPILEVSLHTGVRVRDFDTAARKQVMSNRAAYKRARAGDLAYNMMRMWQGAVGVAPVDGLVSPAYVVARPFDPSGTPYFNLLFRTPDYMREVENFSRGIVPDRNRLYWEAFKQIQTPVPPAEDRTAIIRYLLHLDGKVRRFTASKKRLIALLNEQKQAIIHRTVTRGLDGTVRLKPSDVEGLGDVPEHWSMKRLSHLTDPRRPIMYGIVLPGPNVDEGVYIVKGGNCEPGRLQREYLSKTTFDIEARYARSRLRHPDLVFAIRGGVGATETVPADLDGANLTQDAARVAPADGVHPAWLLYTLRATATQRQAEKQIVGATIRGLNIRDLKRIMIALPPFAEQVAIAAYLVEALRESEAATASASREIALLTEFRIRLINDVVTGRVDIRKAVTRLPVDGNERIPEIANDLNNADFQEDELGATEDDFE
jgi:type I restriction enzyme S subunit